MRRLGRRAGVSPLFLKKFSSFFFRFFYCFTSDYDPQGNGRGGDDGRKQGWRGMPPTRATTGNDDGDDDCGNDEAPTIGQGALCFTTILRSTGQTDWSTTGDNGQRRRRATKAVTTAARMIMMTHFPAQILNSQTLSTNRGHCHSRQQGHLVERSPRTMANVTNRSHLIGSQMVSICYVTIARDFSPYMPRRARWSRLHKTVRDITIIVNPWTRRESFKREFTLEPHTICSENGITV